MEVAGDVIDLFDLDSSEGSTRDEEEFEDGFVTDFIDVYDDQTSDEEDTQPRFGGYEYEFVDEVSDSQKCPVCLLPMRDAVQTLECGHRFCKDCLQRILRDARPVCPNDRREIEKEGGYFPDKAWTRDILCLRVKCKRNDRGCDWIGELGHAEDHKGECDYEDEKCLACDVDIQRRLKETHHNEECPKRIIECVHCQDEFTFIQKQEHEDTYCKRFPLVCTNNCGHEEIPREEMEWHLSYKCPMTEVTCPYAKAGCPFQDKRAHLNDHLEASIDDHLEVIWSSLLVAKQELDNMKDLRQKFHEIQEVNQNLTESMAASREEVRDLTLTVKSLEIQNIQLKKWTEDMTRKMASEILTEFMAATRKEVLLLKLAMQNIEMQNVQQKKSMEDMARKMAKDRPTVSDLDFRKEVRDLKLAIKNLEMQNTRQTTTVEGIQKKMASGMKSLEIQMDQVKANRAWEKAQSPYLPKSIPTHPVMLAGALSSTSPDMSPREESKTGQDIQESPACEKAQFLSLQKSIPTHPVTLASPPSTSTPYIWLREESKKVQDIQKSNLIAKFTLKD